MINLTISKEEVLDILSHCWPYLKPETKRVISDAIVSSVSERPRDRFRLKPFGLTWRDEPSSPVVVTPLSEQNTEIHCNVDYLAFDDVESNIQYRGFESPVFYPEN